MRGGGDRVAWVVVEEPPRSLSCRSHALHAEDAGAVAVAGGGVIQAAAGSSSRVGAPVCRQGSTVVSAPGSRSRAARGSSPGGVGCPSGRALGPHVGRTGGSSALRCGSQATAGRRGTGMGRPAGVAHCQVSSGLWGRAGMRTSIPACRLQASPPDDYALVELRLEGAELLCLKAPQRRTRWRLQRQQQQEQQQQQAQGSHLSWVCEEVNP